jgi:hypothetical protein
MLTLALLAAQGLPACTPERASRTSIEAIAAEPAKWLDRCVTVSGIADSLRLHTNVDAIYRFSRLGADGNPAPADRRLHVGIDRQELRSSPALRARATRIEVTGIVDSCERRFQRVVDAGGVPFLGGYCHYYRGPTIAVTRYSISGQNYSRLVGEAARRRVGSLVEPPRDWEWRDELEAVGNDFVGALRAGNRARLAELLSYGAPLEEERIDALLSGPAYRVLREGRVGKAKLLTRAVNGRFLPSTGSNSDHTSAYLCYCKTADCEGLWPIASIDADAGQGRPYACVSVSGRVAAPAQLEMHISEGGGWLAEPRRN